MEVDGEEAPEMPTINDNLFLREIRWIQSIMNVNLPPNQIIKVVFYLNYLNGGSRLKALQWIFFPNSNTNFRKILDVFTMCEFAFGIGKNF